MSDQLPQCSQEEIIASLQTPVDYTSSPTDKLHNPSSVSSFFLRNIGKPKCEKVKPKRPADDDDDQEEEPLADVALAKWWRKQSRILKDVTKDTCSQNPNTLLSIVTRSDVGVEFLQTEIKRLRRKIESGSSSSSVSSALSSFYERLGNLSLATMHLERALQLDSTNKETQWRMLRLNRAVRLRKQQEKALSEMDYNTMSDLIVPLPEQVACVPVDNLSVKDFLFNHAIPGVPVIITGLVSQMTPTPWTLQHIVQVAGDCKAQLKRHVKESASWARLEDARESTVRAFIDGLTSEGDREQLYLFDWSLPLHCPDLANELTIPKYFAGDFLQRTQPDSYYQDSWPSLFVAPAGLVSELHVDAFGSNFWMALFKGRKRWTFFKKEDTFKLYPSYEHPWSSDPVFAVDLDKPDTKLFPLLSRAQPIQCVLEPGELLFVPAGCPHRVENLETSLAISGNFVDLSNIDSVREELAMTSLVDDRSHDLYKQLSDPEFKTSMQSDLDHLPWKAFKTWTSWDYSACDITYKSVKETLAALQDTRSIK